jgi:hypothetical protein
VRPPPPELSLRLHPPAKCSSNVIIISLLSCHDCGHCCGHLENKEEQEALVQSQSVSSSMENNSFFIVHVAHEIQREVIAEKLLVLPNFGYRTSS